MRKSKIIISLFLALGLFVACAEKSYSTAEKVFLVLKTKSIKYADLGFFYEGKEGIKIEMYSNAQALRALEIDNERVCISQFECMGKEVFNTKVLSSSYPKDILSDIFRGKSIFQTQNYLKVTNGFIQKIEKEGFYTINYSVLGNKIVFIDRLNKITIKMKRLK